ncbi:MAG: hypothetical protein LUQ41_00495 [Methanomicrobiales archaeon]|nr:hypothetical protein [Methanomicrobiales archaeon]
MPPNDGDIQEHCRNDEENDRGEETQQEDENGERRETTFCDEGLDQGYQGEEEYQESRKQVDYVDGQVLQAVKEKPALPLQLRW